MNKTRSAELPFFFIVGKGRSGTTLLQTILDSHPQVLIPLESRIIIHLYSKYGGSRHWDREKRMQFYHDLKTDVKFDLLWKVDDQGLQEALLNAPDDAYFSDLCKLVYLSYQSIFGEKDVGLIGDKNPIYTVFIEQLLQLYPKAKFIHLVRDYRDNILSHIKVFPIKDKAFLAEKWVRYNQLVEKFKKQYPDQFLTVRYEDLVAEPESHVRQICEFLEIEFTPAMLFFHKGTKDAYDDYAAYIDKFHKNLLKPVNAKSVGKWKTDLAQEHVRKAEMVAGDYGQRYGYEPSLPPEKNRWVMMMSKLKYAFWWQMMHRYYATPLFIRTAYSNLFKAMFGKGYRKKVV